MKKQMITLMCATALLSSCHIYKAYDRPEDIHAEGLYRDTVSVNDTLVSDTANFGNLPWREVFTDAQLQQLIERGLANNADLQIAHLKVKEAKAALMSAKIAYAPSLALSPQGTISSFDKQPVTKTYTLPVSAQWEIDLFGKLLNAKRGAKTTLMQTEAYRQAVQTQIISGIANIYYTLLMLDEQLQITEETAAIMWRNVETMRAMKEAGMTNGAAVAQSEAAHALIQATLPDIRHSIFETENALCLLLQEAPHRIERSTLEQQQLPVQFSVGVPLQLLSNRPDVKAAEMALAGTYYNANAARAAFYPHITLGGNVGWTNAAGAAIFNPGKLIASVLGSLTQPLFYRGANLARLKIAKAQQEEAKITFQKTILNAGTEVSNALALYQNSTEKSESRKQQVEAAQKAAESTKELFQLANASYLEVLSAEQSYLSARLSEVSDTFERMQSIVSLYRALGGGREN